MGAHSGIHSGNQLFHVQINIWLIDDVQDERIIFLYNI